MPPLIDPRAKAARQSEIETRLAELGCRMEPSLDALDEAGHAVVDLETGELVDVLEGEVLALAEEWSILEGPCVADAVRGPPRAKQAPSG